MTIKKECLGAQVQRTKTVGGELSKIVSYTYSDGTIIIAQRILSNDFKPELGFTLLRNVGKMFYIERVFSIRYTTLLNIVATSNYIFDVELIDRKLFA